MRDFTGGRCYGCFRPTEDCFCTVVPTIDNRTHLLILQHKRERFHRFGTARIVRRALRNSELRVGLDGEFSAGLGLQPGAGLLYPGPEATPLDALPSNRRPRQLVVLDGTWHHAKTMVRDLPELQRLPRYRLAPTEPSRYRFRREPRAECISTVEATIAALRTLEPDLAGLDELMRAFLTMVNRQLARPKSDGVRVRKRPRRTFKNIPRALVGGGESIVVAYGESLPRDAATHAAARPPVYWVAERLGSGECFACFITPDAVPDAALLDHWELSGREFVGASSLSEACAAWQAFLRPTDVPTVFNQATARLAASLGTPADRCLVLKSVDFGAAGRAATLDAWLAAAGVEPAAPRQPGRAGRRLTNLAALVRHLQATATAALRGPHELG